MENESHQLYYDPSRFSAFDATSWPGPLEQNLFPLVMPDWAGDSEVRCVRLYTTLKEDLRTRNATKTRPATAVKNLQDIEQQRANTLLKISYSPTLVDNLFAYAGAIPTPEDQEGPVPLNTWFSANRIRRPIASPECQSEALRGLIQWFLLHKRPRVNVMVNGEEAVQDEVRTQLLAPLNFLLRTRYQDASEDHRAEVPGGALYYHPIWRRAVHADGNAPELVPGKDRPPGKAGHPDFILTMDLKRTRESVGPMVEAKTFWSYKSEYMRKIFTNWLVDADGTIDWDRVNTSTQRDILEQLWGELHFHDAKWVIWTNAEIVVFIVKTDDHELTLSKPVKWTSAKLLKVAHGFTLASIDSLLDEQIMGSIVGAREARQDDLEDDE